MLSQPLHVFVSFGSCGFYGFVEKNIDELEAEEGEASRVENADSVESEDNIVVDDSRCDNAGFQNKDDEEFENDTTIGGSEDVQDLNATLEKLTVLTLKQATEESISNFTDHLDTPVQLKEDEHNVVEVCSARNGKCCLYNC
ncbi:cyclic AMP-dependent transcription factor ATF-2 [Striga asiatica]|uniref:Cyclic AMP-dependent transcription factor ATF-2 n=1 Tax=Striga asiatica TaxID=4170 RepID=A0A5A7QHJ8_STRAF|nr:cyclic AMP-dependent transcription factor ATF-2 [Striga asiatica]